MSEAEHSASRKVEPAKGAGGYIVLVRATSQVLTGEPTAAGTTGWLEVGKASSRSADAAIREAVAKLPEPDRKGTFVAIPARSFKPVTVSEKVERTLVIGA